MPCFKLRDGWFDVSSGERQGRPLMRFPVGEDPYDWERVDLKCRNCIGCRGDRARDVSLRASHEAMMVSASCFLTLTYDRGHLPIITSTLSAEGQRQALERPATVMPYGGSLRRRDVELFMKRLRDYLHRHYGVRVRGYLVGEYGERSSRPHYHALLWGFDFGHDRVPAGKSQGGHPMWSSKLLDELWTHGFCRINEMGQEVAQYAAKYALKSLGAKHELRRLVDGRIVEVEPPFDSLPHGKALGLPWLERFWTDVFPRGVVVLRGGVQLPAPLAYMKACKERDPATFERIADERRREAAKRLADAMPARLAAREGVAHARARQSKREAV